MNFLVSSHNSQKKRRELPRGAKLASLPNRDKLGKALAQNRETLAQATSANVAGNCRCSDFQVVLTR